MYIRSGEAHLVTIIREDEVGRNIASRSGPVDLENSTEGMDRVQSVQLVNVHNGPADLEMILREERREKHIERLQEETEERGEILVMGETLYVIPFSHC
jgi:hypothetical protein